MRLLSLWSRFTVGLYYAVTRSFHQTQIEALVGFPLLAVCAVGSSRRLADRSGLRYFLAGCCSGLVLFFKLAYAPIALALWLVLLVGPGRRLREGWAAGLVRLVAGAAVPMALVASYLAATGTLDDFVELSLVYPMEATGELGTEFGRLNHTLRWFVKPPWPRRGHRLVTDWSRIACNEASSSEPGERDAR